METKTEIINQARIWVSAIIYKGNQLFELQNSNRGATPDDMNFAWEHYHKSIKNNEIINIETHFFLISINKAKRWLEKLESNEEIISAISIFENSKKCKRY